MRYTDHREHIDLIPDHMQESVLAWIETGRGVGNFLTAVIHNDLFMAFHRADSTNQAAMKQYVEYFYNWTPHGCHGSPERAKKWAEAGGLIGVEAAQDAKEAPQPTFSPFTPDEEVWVQVIIDRAKVFFEEAGIHRDLLTLRMDLSAVHESCPLDLAVLAEFNDGDFGHDLGGIYRHLNRETGQLEDCFLPRCSR